MADYYPQTPAFDTATDLWTFQDAVEHVLDRFNLSRDEPRALRQGRRAVTNAYRDLPNKERWSYYERRGRIVTVASQVTGTIDYDHAGGAFERLVTLTGATFPTNARDYTLLIDRKAYPIEEYKDPVTVTLTQAMNPGADLALGTKYNLYRGSYPVPIDFRRGSPLVDMANKYYPDYESPGDFIETLASQYTPSTPRRYTIRNTGDGYGGLSFDFAPPPSTVRYYDFIYEASPRQLTTERINTGVVLATAGSAAIVGTGTAWNQNHVGSIFRISATDDFPTGRFGGLDDSDTPYIAQRVVMAVTDATHLTLDAAVHATATYTNVGYTLSDPIDVQAGSMMSYFLRLCEAEFASAIRGMEADDRARYYAEAKTALIEAMRNDTPNRTIGRDGMDTYFFRLGDWAYPEPLGGSVV